MCVCACVCACPYESTGLTVCHCVHFNNSDFNSCKTVPPSLIVPDYRINFSLFGTIIGKTGYSYISGTKTKPLYCFKATLVCVSYWDLEFLWISRQLQFRFNYTYDWHKLVVLYLQYFCGNLAQSITIIIKVGVRMNSLSRALACCCHNQSNQLLSFA